MLNWNDLALPVSTLALGTVALLVGLVGNLPTSFRHFLDSQIASRGARATAKKPNDDDRSAGGA